MERGDRDRPLVVVADDDPTMRELFSRALRGAGYQVVVAMDVPEAMTLLIRPGVRAAVLDMLFVNSGGRSGLDLLQFIRHDSLLTGLPVIIVTGFVLNPSVRKQVEALGAEVWHKPFEINHLARRLDELVRRGKAADHSDRNEL